MPVITIDALPFAPAQIVLVLTGGARAGKVLPSNGAELSLLDIINKLSGRIRAGIGIIRIQLTKLDLDIIAAYLQSDGAASSLIGGISIISSYGYRLTLANAELILVKTPVLGEDTASEIPIDGSLIINNAGDRNVGYAWDIGGDRGVDRRIVASCKG